MRRTPWLCGFAAALFLGSYAGSVDTPVAWTADETYRFRRVVAIHLERYPAMEMQDLYKLVYQAAMGSEHAVTDREAAREWLAREVSTLTPPKEEEPMTDPLPLEGKLVRVNLRPYVDRGGNLEELLDAFTETASGYTASPERLERYWQAVESMAEAGALRFSKEQLVEHFDSLRKQGLPPVRHSAAYRSLYEPAYRVILLDVEPVE